MASCMWFAGQRQCRCIVMGVCHSLIPRPSPSSYLNFKLRSTSHNKKQRLQYSGINRGCMQYSGIFKSMLVQLVIITCFCLDSFHITEFTVFILLHERNAHCWLGYWMLLVLFFWSKWIQLKAHLRDSASEFYYPSQARQTTARPVDKKLSLDDIEQYIYNLLLHSLGQTLQEKNNFCIGPPYKWANTDSLGANKWWKAGQGPRNEAMLVWVVTLTKVCWCHNMEWTRGTSCFVSLVVDMGQRW